MRAVGNQLRFSPSDLADFIGCEHLTQLALAAALGELSRPSFSNPYADLIRRKGDQHEKAFLNSLLDAGHDVRQISLGDNGDFGAAVDATNGAMRAGASYIYQAAFTVNSWRGVADFLERVERPCALGDWSYEILDTKLAHHPHPRHALQLCFYTQALREVQKLEPEIAYLVLGTRVRLPIRIADVGAYFRHARQRFDLAITNRTQAAPYPCEHCQFCDFEPLCDEQWEREDHLTRVAGIRHDQIVRFGGAGITTLTKLAECAADTRILKMNPATFESLHEQAALQLETQHSGRIAWRELAVEGGRGFAALPPLSTGDIVLDLEGHPFFEPARGLEFLFGALTLDTGEPRYVRFWGHDQAGERRAFEAFIDLVHGQLAKYPDLHVYHFGAHEQTAIKRLMGEYATRESEVDALLRRKTFVDLYTLLRQAMRVGVRSYSLKQVEALTGFARSANVRSGAEAILEYERWIETKDDQCLARIAAYNEEDCRATLAVLEWLHDLRPADIPWPEEPPTRTISEDAAEAQTTRQRLREELLDGSEPGTGRWLAAEILEYHRREARPAWWWYFERLGMTPEELIEDTESIGCLEADPTLPATPRKRSLVHTLRFPPQEHKLGPGSADDPKTGKSAGEVLAIDDTTGTLQLLRGPKFAKAETPRALVPVGPYDDRQQRNALLRIAESIRNGDPHYAAAKAILNRERPSIAGRSSGGSIQTTDLDEMKDIALGLNESYLFIQGPPGAGKTWTGARIVAHLLASHRRVGIAAQSHKAIHNLLKEIEAVACDEHIIFRGVKKSTSDNPDSVYDDNFITSESEQAKIFESLSDIQLLAGTAWLFARNELDRKLDYLVIDEAGQMALANAVAMGTAARNLILLGDPLQLAQVSQGTHPQGTGASVLEHLLGESATIPEDRGIFLERSFRMHPDVCAFISEIVYGGRLRSDEIAARRTTSFGTGIQFIPVDHQGNRSASDEEVARIQQRVAEMLQGSFTDKDGSTRALREEDFMVVAPYNAQVRRLRAAVPPEIRVGTVDKFQGQQAPIVFFSMATSSGEDVPRNLAFLLSRNRLNVAISRAQCLAVLVCSPRLLEARCHSIEEMALVNALCRLAEYARGARY